MARSKDHLLRVGPQGRVVIPAHIRKELGIQTGDILLARKDNNKLVLETRNDMQEKLLGMFKGVRRSLSEELIEERKREAKKESQRMR